MDVVDYSCIVLSGFRYPLDGSIGIPCCLMALTSYTPSDLDGLILAVCLSCGHTLAS